MSTDRLTDHGPSRGVTLGRLLLRAIPVTTVRRVAWSTASAFLASGLLVLLFGWVALATEWVVPEPEGLDEPSVVTARDGTVLARFDAEVDRRLVVLDEVSDAAITAVVAAEDHRFYEHEGVDTIALLRAVVTNVRTGAITQGGSTLTQQYVKNAFTGSDRTFMRKVREAVISVQLEREETKEGILTSYLNTVYFGEGAYGIEAAARTFFDVPAAELDLAEAAALAQALPAPSVRNPRVDPAGTVSRRDALLRRMASLDLITSAEADEAITRPLEVRDHEPRRHREPYVVAHVRSVIEETFGRDVLHTGALTIRTTLDLDAQAELHEAVEAHLPPEESGFEMGAIVIDPPTGEIRALYGGRDFYGDTSTYSRTDYAQVNLATQGARQAGSTFKPFVLAAAMEQGITPQARYPAPAQASIGDWEPRNADGRGYGELDLVEAMVRSVNTTFAHLGIDVGPEAIADVAARLGVRNPLEPEVTISLGATAGGPSVLDMASAYATLANDGLACPAQIVLEVRGPDGRLMERPAERTPPPELLDGRPEGLAEHDEDGCYQAVDPDIARTINGVLEQAVERGTGTRARIDRTQAGKTGTANEVTDAWFAGYTPDLSLTVWIGDPDERRTVTDVGGFSPVFGGTVPALVWSEAAERLLRDVPDRPFALPGEDREAGGDRGPGPRMEPPRDPTPSPSPSPEPDPPSDEDTTEGPPSDPGTDESDEEDEDDEEGGTCIPPIITSGC